MQGKAVPHPELHAESQAMDVELTRITTKPSFKPGQSFSHGTPIKVDARKPAATVLPSLQIFANMTVAHVACFGSLDLAKNRRISSWLTNRSVPPLVPLQLS